MNTTSKSNLSRRNFLKGGAIAAVAAGAGAMLPVTAGASGQQSMQAYAADSASDVYPQSIDQDPYFTKPNPITDISETITADVVVVGAGAAGVPAACAAAENGAKVVCLQKAARVYSHGIIWAGFNAPALIEEMGFEYSKEDITKLKQEFQELNHYGTDTALLNKFFDEVPEAIDWQINTARGFGLQPMFFGKESHVVAWPMQASALYQTFADNFSETHDLEMRYSTPAKQLVTDDSGRVTGVIAQDKSGNYIQVNASKGVVIATGAYGGNQELLKRWCPSATIFPNGAYPEDNQGDGDMMAIWAGADISQLPHSKKIDIRFYGTSPARTDIEKQPFLLVNDKGHRMGREDATEMMQNNEFMHEPSSNGTYYCIFDKNYDKWLESILGERAAGAILTDEQIENYKNTARPMLWEADSIEDLAKQIGVDPEELAATVSRNNELAEAGEDTDYYKDPANLYKIDTAPYYAMVRQYTIGAMLGGLKVNDECNVLSRSTGEPIEGLYAVGNDMGGLQTSPDYVWHDYGFTLGPATTFGYMVGRNLATA